MSDQALPIIVLGAGGHAAVLIEALLLAEKPVGDWVMDDDPALQGSRIDGRLVCGGDQVFTRSNDSIQLANGVGSAALPHARESIYERFASKGYRFVDVVHPAAVISLSAELGQGVQVMAGAVVQARARIGANTILNTRCSVDHDCVIGDHTHLAPGVTLSGQVNIGKGCHLGTGAVVIQGVTIGEGAMIAAGAVVASDVAPGQTVMGVPARVRE